MRCLILTGLTYYNRSYSLSEIIKTQAQMLKEHGHEVALIVAKGMTNKENLDGYTLHEVITNDEQETLNGFREVVKNFDIVFTHDFVWIDYMKPLNALIAIIEDEYSNVRFYHHVHSAPGTEKCADWKKARNKQNVTYCYPNEIDLQRFKDHIQAERAITIRLTNNVFDSMGGDENLYERLGLMNVDYVGFYPAHPMPGKQVPEILKCVRAMKKRGLSVKYILTLNGCQSGAALDRVNEYRRIIKEYGIENEMVLMPDYPEFAGETPYNVVQKLWKITNLFITPSASETTSLMLLEAMAHRCLIIANDSLPLNHEILQYGAIFHPFGSHLNNASAMDDASLDKMVNIMESWRNNHNNLYCLNRLKRMYSRESIYQTYYKPLLDVPVNPKISVVIPILNKWPDTVEFTKKTIETVRAYKNAEIILINNYKEDENTYDCDKYIVNNDNVGVSKAWNQGLRVATGEYIMILNSDIELPNNWAEEMIKHDGIIFPHVNNIQPKIDQFAFPWVHGCCFMAKREVFEKIGEFDERFFAYYEDADYWKRAVIAGMQPSRANILVKHAINATSGKLTNLSEILQESERKFKEKWIYG